MKASSIILMAALLLGAAPAMAQSGKGNKTTLAAKAKSVWGKTKSTVSNATDKVKHELGIKDNDEEAAVRVKYMPIFTNDDYKAADAEQLKQTCRERFLAKYPHTAIQRTVIPMDNWESTAVEYAGEVKGYIQELRVYILAKDGNDGYMNAEYTYQRYKEIGGIYNAVSEKWPACTRVDIIPQADYDIIK